MKSIITVGLLIAVSLSSGCSTSPNFDARLNAIVQPYRFSIFGWEYKTVFQQVGQWLSGGPEEPTETDNEVEIVIEYFDSVNRIKDLQSEILAANSETAGSILMQERLQNLKDKQAALAATVERIIEKQIRETLSDQGIFNPITGLTIGFPPVSFKMEELPSLLVISPRDRIESIREIVLQQNLTLKETEAIEASVDRLGVSSLVVAVGGIATFPNLVDSEASLRCTLDTVAHEWLHLYLAFTPLGLRYILDLTGLLSNYDIATMNESLADMVGKEIGAMVYNKYYASYEYGNEEEEEDESNETEGTGFDFNLEMREIRKAVDVFLAQGEIEQAEAFMEQKRQELVSKGYYIRRLNQAYFAIHGTYADSPAFINPIGLELQELRDKSGSLKEFLNTVAAMTSHQDLIESIR
jgi:hypothetical protein